MSVRIVVLALWVVTGLTACATEPVVRGVLHYGLDEAPEGRGLVWPQAPEVPRYLYVGTLTGEQNFRRPEAQQGLRALGRWLVGLDRRSAVPVVLQRPSAVIGDDQGRIFVGDTSRQAVFVFDEPAGELLVWEHAEGTVNFVAPSGLALSARGGVYVADAELGAVFELDRSGAPRATIGRGVLQRPTGLASDATTGRLFVADTYAHDVKVFDSAGALLQVIGHRGTGDGEFNFPTQLSYVQGRLYVSDTLNARIQVFDGERFGLLRRFGERGLYVGNLVRPKGVSVDSEGNVYVVESYYDTLLIFNPQGELLLSIGGHGTETGRFFLPSGIWVDGRNRVHIADMFNGRVVLFQFLGGG